MYQNIIHFEGKQFGPFDSNVAESLNEILNERYDLTPAHALDVWQGTICGDLVYLFSKDFRGSPFREVHQVMDQDDLGNIVFDTGRQLHFLKPTDLVFVQEASERNIPPSRYPRIISPEEQLALTKGSIAVVKRVPDPLGYGEFLLGARLEKGEKPPRSVTCLLKNRIWYVGWKQDRRYNLKIIGMHATMEYALAHFDQYVRDYIRPPKQRNRPNRDYQRSLVYEWEDPYLSEDPVTLEEAQDLVRKIFRTYGLTKIPVVSHNPDLKMRCYFSKQTGIRVADWGLNVGTILHETAHAVLDYKYWHKTIIPHGPEFVSLLMDILEQFDNQKRSWMIRRANLLGVDYIS